MADIQIPRSELEKQISEHSYKEFPECPIQRNYLRTFDTKSCIHNSLRLYRPARYIFLIITVSSLMLVYAPEKC